MENLLEDYSKLLDDSTEHLSYQAIAAYLNLKEQLSDKERNFVERHIKICSECKKKYELIQAEDLEIDTGRKQQLKFFRLAGYRKYAAAAVIIIGILAALYILFQPEKVKLLTEDVSPKDSSGRTEIVSVDSTAHLQKPEPVEESKKEIISNKDEELFAVNTVLENFINRNIRSNKTIEIISPEIGDTVSSTITFEWKRINPIGRLVLTVVDNKNTPVYEMTVEGSTLVIDKKLKAGLYYWKLEADGKLEAVGKFYVK